MVVNREISSIFDFLSICQIPDNECNGLAAFIYWNPNGRLETLAYQLSWCHLGSFKIKFEFKENK
jgi:hypothetical protein